MKVRNIYLPVFYTSYSQLDGEKVDDHSRYCAGSGNDICRVWACCQACPS
ncbi:hypothetical protein Hanom_Chr15g01379871 [Helianthus anomalus]